MTKEKKKVQQIPRNITSVTKITVLSTAKVLNFESETSVNHVFKLIWARVSKTLVFVQHNIGFIKYHNSRTNIYMPACFLTKMAAIGKDDGSEIEENKTVG